MMNATTERLPVRPAPPLANAIRAALQDADAERVASAQRLGGAIRATLGTLATERASQLVRASRLVRCAERSARRGNNIRAQRYARVARQWAGLAPAREV